MAGRPGVVKTAAPDAAAPGARPASPRSPRLATSGLFLTLAPNGTRALADLGPLADLTDHGIITTAIALLDERGKRLGIFDQSDFATEFGGPSLTIARSALINFLLNWADRCGADIRFSTRLTGLANPATSVTAHFNTGPGLTFDWLAACDGIASTARRLRCLWPRYPNKPA